MSVKVTYANIESAERGMRKRGLMAWQPHYWRASVDSSGKSLAPNEHFDIEGASVGRRIDTPVAVVEYHYWNRRNEPRRVVRRPSAPTTRDPIDKATFALRAALMAKDMRETRT